MKPSQINLISGLFLGSLVGLLIGLSVSQVVGTVLGALTSLLVAFFGLKDGDAANNLSKTLISAFCAGCIIFVLVGIFLRARDVLSPSVNYYKKELQALNLDSNQVKKIVLLKKYGISITEKGDAAVKIDEKAADIMSKTSTSLFASHVTDTEMDKILAGYQKMPYDSLVNDIDRNGLLYSQFHKSLDLDIKDTTIKKRIFLQLIAITYHK